MKYSVQFSKWEMFTKSLSSLPRVCGNGSNHTLKSATRFCKWKKLVSVKQNQNKVVMFMVMLKMTKATNMYTVGYLATWWLISSWICPLKTENLFMKCLLSTYVVVDIRSQIVRRPRYEAHVFMVGSWENSLDHLRLPSHTFGLLE
jgi:hypothetical protein